MTGFKNYYHCVKHYIVHALAKQDRHEETIKNIARTLGSGTRLAQEPCPPLWWWGISVLVCVFINNPPGERQVTFKTR